MRITIAAVGRLKDGAERVLVDRYVERLALGRSIGITRVDEAEIAESRRGSVPERLADEAARLAGTIAQADATAALVVDGRAMTSDAFARWLAARRDGGTRQLAFLIGGPDGLSPEISAPAVLKLSLGAMTLPHGLARAVLAEQIYRAVTILSGHPYHRA